MTILPVLVALDFRPYTTSVRVPAIYAVPLARELRKRAPRNLPSVIQTALATTDELANHVKIILDERDKTSPLQVRPQLQSCQSCWIAIAGALEAKTRVPAEISGAAAQASELLAGYFPDGTAFTRLDARGFWSEAQRRLERMQRDGDVTRLTQLVGKDLVLAARKTTADLGEAIGVGEATREPAPSSTALQETLFRFSRAVGRYGRLMAARVDEDDPGSVAEFRAAMAPIDEYRATRGKEAEDEPALEPTEPAVPTPPST